MSNTILLNNSNLGSNTGSILSSSQTRTLSVTLIPFIRSRKVYFYARGLLPNTTHDAFFDGVDVSDWCREETFTRIADSTTQDSTSSNNTATSHPDGSTALISDSNGEIQGSFFIPNTSSLRFRVGSRVFKLRDSNATTDDNAISKAYATYTARGTLETNQVVNTFTQIRPRPAVNFPNRRLRDPVAQSFVIPNEEGCFITEIRVPFKTASSTKPISCQIRTMELGLPTTNIIGQKWLSGATVSATVSNSPSFGNASTYATFTFDEPIYVEGGVEYAIVLETDSLDYEVWTAVAGKFLLGSNTRRLMKQPTLGSFFKSQNGSTWTPDQERDMMFRIRRAVFTTSAATAYFENVDLPVTKLGSNPILTTNTSGTIRIYHPNHGLLASDKVTISGAVDTNGITAAQINTQQTVVDADDADSYTVTTAGTATSTGRGGGTAVKAYHNYPYNIAHFAVNALKFPETTLNFSLKTTSSQSLAGSETAYSKDSSYNATYPNTDIDFTSVKMVASAENETASLSGERSIALKASMQTTSDFLSPVIDLQRLSATLVGRRIDNQAASPATGFNVPASFVAETDANNGSSIAKHITKPVTLSEPAVGLKLIFSANRPSDSSIEVYYKVLESGSDVSFGDTAWVAATIDETIQSDEDKSIYRDYNYTIEEDPFTRFQLKFVFKSSNQAKYPTIKDLRVIALAT